MHACMVFQYTTTTYPPLPESTGVEPADPLPKSTGVEPADPLPESTGVELADPLNSAISMGGRKGLVWLCITFCTW